VPQRQPKRGRLWLADGSCVRLRPEHANHVWTYDFVEDRTRAGRKFRMLCVVDEFTREALASLGTAIARLSCKVEGIEAGRGGIELRADWHIDNRRRPELKPTVVPFRPTPATGMQQVRVRVQGAVASQYEYLFDPGKIAWAPIYDPEGGLVAMPGEDTAQGTELALFDTPARVDAPWQRVRGLQRAKPAGSDARQLALWESTPESEAFILFSPRRRKLTPRRERPERADTP
jgi:hypothetical protein